MLHFSIRAACFNLEPLVTAFYCSLLTLTGGLSFVVISSESVACRFIYIEIYFGKIKPVFELQSAYAVMFFKSDWKYSINAKTFDGVDVSLFRNFRFTTLFNYVFLAWGLTILKFSLLVSDIYTCIKLLAFNSWSNNIIRPYLSFAISKWLFSGCILASILLLIWEMIVGVGIYRTRNISLTYVNNFARTIYSVSNYSIFCVLDRITPKGSYQRVAFFTFFELKDCFRLLFTDTPRQVINGLTLWSVLVTVNSSSDLGDLESFNGLITKIKIIAKTNHEEAVVLSFMLFSFIVWLIFITKLVMAMIFSIFVYYRLINQHKYNGLKEFVCVTISYRVDAIVEKQRRMKNQDKGPYKKGLQLTSTTSFFPMDDLESQGGVNSSRNMTSTVSLPEAFKDSRAALMGEPYTNSNSRVSSTGSNTKDACSIEEKMLEDYETTEEPLKMTSAINIGPEQPKVNATFHATTNENRPAAQSDMFSSNSIDTLPSYHVKQPAANGFDRPRPPALQTSMVHSNIRQDPQGHGQNHIYTPTRAYTREPYPTRSTSLLDRRENIANEDYSHYTRR